MAGIASNPLLLLAGVDLIERSLLCLVDGIVMKVQSYDFILSFGSSYIKMLIHVLYI